jgi:hypothetical protein
LKGREKALVSLDGEGESLGLPLKGREKALVSLDGEGESLGLP